MPAYIYIIILPFSNFALVYFFVFCHFLLVIWAAMIIQFWKLVCVLLRKIPSFLNATKLLLKDGKLQAWWSRGYIARSRLNSPTMDCESILLWIKAFAVLSTLYITTIGMLAKKTFEDIADRLTIKIIICTTCVALQPCNKVFNQTLSSSAVF